MSIVPKAVVVGAPAAWNAQADEFNQWDDLGEDEKLEWTANHVAEWALERAAKECDKKVKIYLSPRYAVGQPASSMAERFAAGRCAEAIRALISPEGKIKGGG
jgi:hypothetical protein